MTSFDGTELPSSFHHQLISTYHDVDETIRELSDFVKKIKLDTNLFVLLLVVREALNNAVLHGNKMNPTKKVDLDLQIDEAKISISIADQGEGFQWQDVINQESTDPTKPSGRGVYGLQQFGYNMRYNDKGNILYLTKEIDY